MTIEKEFFEAFGIEPDNRCINDSDSYYYDCEIKINNKKCIRCKKYKSRNTYIRITPEIMLGLEEIIANQYAGFYYFKTPTYIPETNNYDYDNLIWNFSSDAASSNKYEFITESKGKTRQDALLNFCIEYPDELQTEVRGLFK